MDIQRNLDGVFFRVQRNNKWMNVCFSDLTDEEMNTILAGRSTEWLKEMCKIFDQMDMNSNIPYNVGISLDTLAQDNTVMIHRTNLGIDKEQSGFESSWAISGAID